MRTILWILFLIFCAGLIAELAAQLTRAARRHLRKRRARRDRIAYDLWLERAPAWDYDERADRFTEGPYRGRSRADAMKALGDPMPAAVQRRFNRRRLSKVV